MNKTLEAAYLLVLKSIEELTDDQLQRLNTALWAEEMDRKYYWMEEEDE